MRALEISGLAKKYSNGFEALKGIDLTVEEGDFFALLGPNGAGKTTAIGVITSLVNKTAGTVKVFGHDIDTDFVSAKSCIGVVPQEFNFNNFETVEQIVINQAGYYGVERPVAKERAEKILSALSLWDKRSQRSMTLSGGMKRRLMIARALVHQPKLLILDEPTAGVDIELRRSMWDFLTEINTSGTTIILTTHYLEEAENLCRNVAIIDQGNIVENTDIKSLLRRVNMVKYVLDLRDPLKSEPDLGLGKMKLLDATTLEIDMKSERPVNELFSALDRLGIAVTNIQPKSNRLEEMFVQMTGNNEGGDHAEK